MMPGDRHAGARPVVLMPVARRLRTGALGLVLATACGACAFNPFSAASASPGSSTFVSLSGAVSQSAGNEPVLVRQDGVPLRASFIVKFRNEPETVAIARSWRRDPAGARERFQDWASDKDELCHLVLKSASYSGELVLALPASAPRQHTADSVLAALRSMDNVAYADIDSIAHPSSGGTQ